MSEASSSVRRTAARPAKKVARSADPRGTAVPCVVGGLLRGQPELTLLSKAAAGIARVELVDDRLAVVSAVQSTRPGVLVLPPFDADHTSTAPLVFRVRREVPGVPVIVLSTHPSGAGQPMLRAAHAGARVITLPTHAELHEALADLLHSRESEQ